MFVRTRSHARSIVSLALLFLGSTIASSAQGHVTTRWNVKHDVSAPLSEMIKNAPKATAGAKHEAEPLRRIPLPPGLLPGVEDSVRQSTAVPNLTPAASLSFDGLGNASLGFTVSSAPPDTNGAIGATQYFQIVNSSFAVFNKTTGAKVAGPTTTNTLWAGFGGGCQTNNDGDGIALYDKLANRWVISQFSVSTTPFLQCVAVSTTSDATGTYNRYSFQYSTFDDYPKMGVWPDGYYTTFNMFNGNTFVGADSCAYNRTAMLAGTAAQQVCFQQGSGVGGLLPADLDGTTAPPAGSPNYQIFFGTNSLQMFKFHVDFVNTANSTFTGPTSIPVAAFSPLCGGGTCVVQPAGGNQLDSLADRLMFRLAYRNLGNHESLVTSHAVVAGTSGGVRWYEIQNPSGTPVMAQQSTFAPDSSYRWMSSAAMDQAGNLAVGYTVSSSSVNPSVRFAARLATDPANTLGAEVSAVAGGGVQNGSTSNGPLTRWGDYSAMTVDPVDDCTFWYTQEYMKTTGSFNWNTRIASFKFPSCGASGPTATLNPTSLTFANQNVGTTSAAQNITLSNGGAAALAITGIAASADYAQTNTCGASLAAGVNCNISVTFTPTVAGARTGTITVTDNAPGGTQTASLTGTGVAVGVPDFTVSDSPTSLTVKQGTNGTSTITVASLNSFSSATTLSVSGLPTGVTAAFSVNPVTPPANGSATSVLTLTASATATVGTSTVTITGTSGATSHTATLSLTISSAAATQLLVNPGFETGVATPWVLTSGVLNGPNSTGEPPHSGAWNAWMNGYGTTHTDQTTQTVTIPSTATSATLTFWLHIDTAETTTTTAFDTLSVRVLNSAGTVLSTLGAFSNLNRAAGYQQRSFSVLSFKGQTIKINFLGQEDTSLQTSFVIDDTALNVQ